MFRLLIPKEMDISKPSINALYLTSLFVQHLDKWYANLNIPWSGLKKKIPIITFPLEMHYDWIPVEA